jgi:hypothetical protein
MTHLQWFAFVILPIGVTGAVLAVVGIKLIGRDYRRRAR